MFLTKKKLDDITLFADSMYVVVTNSLVMHLHE